MICGNIVANKTYELRLSHLCGIIYNRALTDIITYLTADRSKKYDFILEYLNDDVVSINYSYLY